ncbi:MAG: cysteine methyltransferase [Brevibacillus sp.]|nr:cysteine methyltransferase [Brevibacillus sp.]
MKNEKKTELYWTWLSYEGWSLYLAATSRGLCFVGSQDRPWDELAHWARQRFPGSTLVRDDERLQTYVASLIEYLRGEKDSFALPLDIQGTPFQLAVWEALCQIPFGQTRTYSEIATQIQRPAAVRAVGAAIGANPVLIAVPCHRVIGKNGALTGYRGGMEMKEVLLQIEQVETPAQRGPLRA